MALASKERQGMKDPDWRAYIEKSQEAINGILADKESLTLENPEVGRQLHAALLALRGKPSDARYHEFDPGQTKQIIDKVVQLGDPYFSALALSVDSKFTSPETRQALVENILSVQDTYSAWIACLQGQGLSIEQKKTLANVVYDHGHEGEIGDVDSMRRQQGW